MDGEPGVCGAPGLACPLPGRAGGRQWAAGKHGASRLEQRAAGMRCLEMPPGTFSVSIGSCGAALCHPRCGRRCPREAARVSYVQISRAQRRWGSVARRSVPWGHFQMSWADFSGVLCAGEELQDCVLIAVQPSWGWEPLWSLGST